MYVTRHFSVKLRTCSLRLRPRILVVRESDVLLTPVQVLNREYF